MLNGFCITVDLSPAAIGLAVAKTGATEAVAGTNASVVLPELLLSVVTVTSALARAGIVNFSVMTFQEKARVVKTVEQVQVLLTVTKACSTQQTAHQRGGKMELPGKRTLDRSYRM